MIISPPLWHMLMKLRAGCICWHEACFSTSVLQVDPVARVTLQAIPQKLRLNKRSGWAVLLGILAAFCFGAVGPAGYSTARPPQEVSRSYLQIRRRRERHAAGRQQDYPCRLEVGHV